MGVEVERKFLVNGDGWRESAHALPIRQGYLSVGLGATVRIRVAGPEAFITVKSQSAGASRAEFEYPIPLADAQAMLRDLCPPPHIEKTRHFIEVAGRAWTVDVFDGDNAGLVLAEVELAHPDDPVTLPEWVGAEVTHDPRYRNSALALAPQGGADAGDALDGDGV